MQYLKAPIKNKSRLDEILNGKIFKGEAWYAFKKALEYAAPSGLVATMPELISSKAACERGHWLWTNGYCVHSEENIGIDRKGIFYRRGEAVVVVVHGGGLLTPERIVKAKKNLAYGQEEFDALLEGKLVKLYDLNHVKNNGVRARRFGVVLPLALAIKAGSYRILENPLAIARAGGLEGLESYLKKAGSMECQNNYSIKFESIASREILGYLFSYAMNQARVPKGRMLYLDSRGMRTISLEEQVIFIATRRVCGVKAVQTIKGRFEELWRKLLGSSMIVLIAGRRGAGKSALGFALLENIAAQGRKCYALGVNQGVLPEYIKSVSSLEEVSSGGVVLVDEGAIAFSSRESMSRKNRELSSLLAIARHKDLSLFLISQNSGMIDKNVVALCDCIALKQGSLLQEKIERPVLQELYRIATPLLKNNNEAYLFSHEFEGIVSSELPSFWSESISKNQRS